jgi:hypothetical protein
MVLRFHASGAGSWGLAQKTTEYNNCADEVNKSPGLCSHICMSGVCQLCVSGACQLCVSGVCQL